LGLDAVEELANERGLSNTGLAGDTQQLAAAGANLVNDALQLPSSPKFGAWDLFQLGQKHVYLATVNDNVEAQRLFRRALELDPTLAAAYGWLSYAVVLGMLYFEAEPDEERMNEAVALARRGVELDDQDALTHFGYGRALLARKASA
jgi:tetratricopeptide (TPR) repeat protein